MKKTQCFFRAANSVIEKNMSKYSKDYYNYLCKEDELKFTFSPYYWQENNPSALCKTSNNRLVLIGNEIILDNIPSGIKQYTDLESDIFNDPFDILCFRKFFEDGLRFGTINVTNGDIEDKDFKLFEHLYGDSLYMVFEERKLDSENPKLKKHRHISFFSDYQLCCLNAHWFLNDLSYRSTVEVPGSWKSTLRKLQRNGFFLKENAITKVPLAEAYYGNRNRENLTLQDRVNLLWKSISDSHYSFAAQIDNPSLEQQLAFFLFRSNIVGFGWMPCLFAKSKLNELVELRND